MHTNLTFDVFSQVEYQLFMERVRSKAQDAIDRANHNFQLNKNHLIQLNDSITQTLQARTMEVHILNFTCTPLCLLNHCPESNILCKTGRKLILVRALGLALVSISGDLFWHDLRPCQQENALDPMSSTCCNASNFLSSKHVLMLQCLGF